MSDKVSLEFSDMPEYLNKNKNIQFNEINENEAVRLIEINGYNNIIAPFKYQIADKNPLNLSENLMIDGRHQYSQKTEFLVWYNLFKNERNGYPIIYKNIVTIKTAFKNILFNTLFLTKNIHSREDLDLYFAVKNHSLVSSTDQSEKSENYIKSINRLREDLKNSYNIYYFVGRAGLGDCNNLFMMQSEDDQKKIIKKMQDLNLCPIPINVLDFNKRMVRIQFIRNCVMHNDSLEVLCRYTYRSKKKLRKSSDRKKYQKLIQYFSVDI